MSIHVINNQDDLFDYREAYNIIENSNVEDLVEHTRKLIEEDDNTIFKSLFYSALVSSAVSDHHTFDSTYDVFTLVTQYTVFTHVFGGVETSLTLFSYQNRSILSFEIYEKVMNKFLNNFISIYINEKLELKSTISHYLRNMHASNWQEFVRNSFEMYKNCIVRYIGVEN